MGSQPKAKHATCGYRGQTGIILLFLQLHTAFTTSWSSMSKRKIQELRKTALTDQSMLGTRQRQCLFSHSPSSWFERSPVAERSSSLDKAAERLGQTSTGSLLNMPLGLTATTGDILIYSIPDTRELHQWVLLPASAVSEAAANSLPKASMGSQNDNLQISSLPNLISSARRQGEGHLHCPWEHPLNLAMFLYLFSQILTCAVPQKIKFTSNQLHKSRLNPSPHYLWTLNLHAEGQSEELPLSH